MIASGRRNPHVLAAILVVLAFYTWTTVSSDWIDGPLDLDRSRQQAQAFLDGNLHLDVPVDPGLRALENPYDVGAHEPFITQEIADLSYYEGKFYAYWGPAPVVLVFLPLRAVGIDANEAVVSLAFAIAGFAFWLLVVEWLRRRLAPDCPGWVRGVGTLAIGLGNFFPVLLRGPAVHRLSLIVACCLVAVTVYLLLRATTSPRRMALLAAAGTCLGLAFATRPPSVGALVVAVGVLAFLARRERWPLREVLRGAAALLLPFAALAAAQLWFNAARFEDPLEFGMRFQISTIPVFYEKPLQLEYVLPGLWFYVLEPFHLRAQFPHLWWSPPPEYPFTLPADYYAKGPVVGLLFAAPLALFAFAFARRGPSGRGRLVAVAVGGLTVLGLGMLLLTASYLPKAMWEYEAYFVGPLLIVGVLGWYVTAARRVWRFVGATAATVTVVAGMAISITIAPAWAPSTYDSLARTFDPLGALMARVAGEPIVASIDDGLDVRPARTFGWVTLNGSSFSVGVKDRRLEVMAARTGVATFEADLLPGPNVPDGVTAYLSVRAETGDVGLTARAGRQQWRLLLRKGRNVLRFHVETSPGLPYTDEDPRRNDLVQVERIEVREG